MSILKKLLYVEDEPDIRAIAQIALADVGGFEVLLCASGSEALAAAPDFDPDLIVLDVMMPEMDGPQTLARLRDLPGLTQTPVVFMTAKAQPQEIQEYLGLGAIGVVTKPFDPMTLGDELRDLWSGR